MTEIQNGQNDRDIQRCDFNVLVIEIWKFDIVWNLSIVIWDLVIIMLEHVETHDGLTA
jgi:hypothetical protein